MNSYIVNGFYFLAFSYVLFGLFKIFLWPEIKMWLYKKVSGSIRLDFFYKPDHVAALSYFMMLVLLTGSLICYMVYFDIGGVNDFFGLKKSTNFEQDQDGTINSFISVVGTVSIAIAGWLFTSRVELLNSIKQHTLNVLLESRLSEEYMRNAYLVNEIFLLNRNNNVKINLSDILSLRPEVQSEMRVRHAIFYILNYFEFISVAVRNRDLDEHLLCASWKGIFIKNHDFFEEVIKKLRADEPVVFENFSLLYKRWSE